MRKTYAYRSNLLENLKIVWIFTFVSFVFIVSFCIFQIGKMISEQYLIQNLERKISEISRENKLMEISFLKKNSLYNVERLVEETQFEKMESVHYIRVPGSIMVAK